jgi:hypothetical protein
MNPSLLSEKRNELVTHFAGINENENATQEFDQKTPLKGISCEIQAQMRE